MVADKYQNALPRLKRSVEKVYEYSKQNNDRFHEFQKFVFQTSMSDDDISMLKTLQKPQIEFNILNAYISRLCGEFSKQEPSIYVVPEDGEPLDPKMIEVLEGHIRHILFEASKHETQYKAYRDSLSGGFSVFKVTTEYANPMSFDQVIKFDRVYEPTLCGFDPMAKLSDKSDGNFCFEIFPLPFEDFERQYPDVPLDDLKFVRQVEGFSWSYKSQRDDIVVLCDYYEKKKKRKKIVRLANNRVVTMDAYKEFLAQWEQMGFIEQPPAIVGEPRWTEVETICRYRFIENVMLEFVETDFDHLPLVFVDGDSVMIRDAVNGAFQQFTKPYVYHAKGTQRLKNFAGQTLANELENMVQHKFKVAKESLPQEEDYLVAYRDVQQASTLVYQAYMDNDPDKPVPAPQEIVRVPPPPEVTNTFTITDQVTQNILGSYDASLGINDNQLSGIAIVEGATQSNAAAMPYVVSFMHALNQVATIILALIPKYYVTPRTIPVRTRDGKQSFQKINQEGGMSFNFDENVLKVKVEAGVNFAIQKSRALGQINALMQSSPAFASFMNQEGLEVLIDNMEFKGVDILKAKALGWQDNQRKLAAQAANQPNPVMIQAQIEQQKVAQKAKSDQIDAQLKAAQIAVAKQEADTERMKVFGDLGMQQTESMVSAAKAQAEEARAAADVAIKVADVHQKERDMQHRHSLEKAELSHKITSERNNK